MTLKGLLYPLGRLPKYNLLNGLTIQAESCIRISAVQHSFGVKREFRSLGYKYNDILLQKVLSSNFLENGKINRPNPIAFRRFSLKAEQSRKTPVSSGYIADKDWQNFEQHYVFTSVRLDPSDVIDLRGQSESEILDTIKSSEFHECSQSFREKILSLDLKKLAILLYATRQREEPKFKEFRFEIVLKLVEHFMAESFGPIENLDFWLFISDTLYITNVGNKAKFNRVLIDRVSQYIGTAISDKQFLHILFLVIQNKYDANLLFRLENRILKILEGASLMDVAIISQAYFKISAKITNTAVLKSIINKLTDFIPFIDLDDPGYTCAVKAIRYSRNLECQDEAQKLIEKLCAIGIEKLYLRSSYNVVQSIKLMESYRLYNKIMIDSGVSNMFENLKDYRLKDIQYLLSSMSILAYQDLQLSQSVICEFDRICDHLLTDRRKEFEKHLVHLMPLLRAFSILNYYNKGLINYTNSALKCSEKLSHIERCPDFAAATLLVCCSTRLESEVKLEDPGGLFKRLGRRIKRSMHLLNEEYRNAISGPRGIYLGFKVPPISELYQRLSNALRYSRQLESPEYRFSYQFTLPHQNYLDLVISKDEKPGNFDRETLVPATLSAGTKHCLIIMNRHEDFLGKNRLSGHKRHLARLLTKLGYSVFQVDVRALNIDELAEKIKKELD